MDLTPRLSDAHALRDRLTAALSIHPGTLATLNGSEVASAARAGAAYITPPALTFPAAGIDYDATWTVHLVAGPSRDTVQAWATLDALLEAVLSHGLPVTKAEPASFQPQQGEPLPCYTLTITG